MIGKLCKTEHGSIVAGGIGSSLIALVFTAIIPLLIFGVGVAWQVIDQKKEAVSSRLNETARALRIAVDRELLGQFAAMDVLAMDGSLDRADLAEFSQSSRRALKVKTEWLNIGLIEPESHRIVAGAPWVPVPAQTSITPESVDAVVRSKKSRVVGVFPSSRLTDAPIILLMVPVMREDKVRFVLGVAMSPQPINDLFNDDQFSSSWTGAVLDSQMRISGRSRSPDHYIGTRATPSLVAQIEANTSGVFSVLNQEGQTVYSSFSRSPVTGWSVAIGVPASDIEGPRQRVLLQVAAAGGAMILLALLLAAFVGREIVKRRDAYEQALRNSEERHRVLFSANKAPMLLIDPETLLIVEANQAALNFYGFDNDQFKSLRITDINQLSPEATALEMRQATMEERDCFYFPHRLASGEIRQVEVYSGPIRIEGRTLLYSIIHDITSRKVAEEKLQQSEKNIKTMLDGAADAIFITNSQGQYQYVNRAASQLLGYSREQLLAMGFPDITPHEDLPEVQGLFNQLLTTGALRHELRLKRSDGTSVAVELSGALLEGGLVFGSCRDITQRKVQDEQMRQLAFFDTLTDLPNRRLLLDRLTQTMALSKRSGAYGALLYIDLDNFKPLNDVHGHDVGDLLLIEVARRLKQSIRETDTVSRFGGDEFVVMIAELASSREVSAEQVAQIAEKIRVVLSLPFLLTVAREGKPDEMVEHRCTASIGVTLFINHESGLEDILKRADLAMYRAKEAGRNTIRFE